MYNIIKWKGKLKAGCKDWTFKIYFLFIAFIELYEI